MDKAPPSPRSVATPGQAFYVWLAVFAGGLVVLYASITAQVWEDYYITFRSSRNLVEGAGLVFQPGERVHTFTSPLGVLVPALGYWLTGSDAGALWFLRLVSAAAVGYAAWVVLTHLREHATQTVLTLTIAFCLGVAEAKQIAFSANGMETGLLLLFTALTWQELTRPGGARWSHLAFSYAALMWTRPDAFVPAGAMTLSWFIFQPRRAEEKKPWLKPVVGGILIGGLFYVPWFAWAWHYYGSPVPQTIIAKSAYIPDGFSLSKLWQAPFQLFRLNAQLDGLFAPPYYTISGWPATVILPLQALGRLAALVWVIPGVARSARAASFATLIGGIYLDQIMPFPWYFSPWTLLGAIALTGLVDLGARSLRGWVQSATRIAATLTSSIALGLFACNVVTAYHQQLLVEELGRKQIGLWLKENARPSDTIFLEPLGYIGYFSQLKTYDIPGLSSREVTALVKAGQKSHVKLIAALQPDWVVLRPQEYAGLNMGASEVMKNYVPTGISDRRGLVASVPFLPGRMLLEFDAVFIIYRRQPNPNVAESNR